MFCFSLAALLAFVSVAVVGRAALANANDLWRQTMVTLVLGVLLTATLAAIIGQDERRRLAAGFAVCGWTYLSLASVPSFGLRHDLLTDKSVAWLYQVAHGSDEPQVGWSRQGVAFSSDGELIVQGSGSTLRWSNLQLTSGSGATYENFADIGHSLWAMAVACLGAVAAHFLSSAPRRRTEQVSSNESATDG